MSSNGNSSSLSQADLLMFDGLLAPTASVSSVSRTPALSASSKAPQPPQQQPASGTDWFSLLATSSSSQPSSANPTPPPVKAPLVVAKPAPAPNYEVMRSLFATPPAASSPSPSPAPPSSGPAPALIPTPSSAPVPVRPLPSGPSAPASLINDDDFGDFISEPTPAPASTPAAPPPPIKSVPPKPPLPLQTAAPPDLPRRQLPPSRASPSSPSSSSTHARTSSNSSSHSRPPPNIPRPPPEYSTLESRTSMQRQTSQRSPQSQQQQQQQPTHLSQAGAIASKPPPRPAASDAHGVPIQPLRFGQHLSGPDGRVVGADLPPLPARQQQVNAKSTRNGGLPAAPSGPKLVDASDEFEPWPEFASNSAPAAPSTASPSRGSHHPPQPQRARLPPPEILLSLFQSNLFPLPMPLFQSLVPLAFPLKRRVISDPKVKSFFEAFILAIEVAIRICAGRKRRDGRFEADKEARETARQWRALRERVAGVGLRDLPNLDASFTLRAYAGEPAELCIVCGVARHEKVRGCTKEVVWDFENGGHSTCIRWWAHEKALMES